MSKINLSSRLRTRLSLQEAVNVPDDIGGYTKTWSNLISLWAEIRPVNNVTQKELFKDARVIEENSYLITIRYIDNINHNMRFVKGADIYNIKSVIAPDDRQELLKIYATIEVN